MKLFPSSFRSLFYALLVSLICLVIFGYANHFHNPFEFDDSHTIVSNQNIHSLQHIPSFFTDATTTSSLPANQAYRPLLTTLNTIDFVLSGKPEPDPFVFHLHIFISFLLVGFFIYLFSLKLFNVSIESPYNPFAALFVSAVFLLHTANAETINYIIARSDISSTLFLLMSMVVYSYFPSKRKYFIYLILMVVSFFIKEPAVVLGLLIFFYHLLFERELSFNQLFKKPSIALPSFLAALPAFVTALLLFLFSRAMTPKTWTSGGSSVLDYLQTQPFVMVHYVWNFILPANLSADTDWGLITNPFDVRVFAGLLFVIASLTLAWKLTAKKETRPLAFGILWFYIALIPTSSVIPFSEVLNDHRVFFPYIGLCISLVWWLFNLYLKHQETIQKNLLSKLIIYLLLCLYFAAHVFGIKQRCEVWRTSENLWYDVTVKSPKNGRGLMNYANTLMSKGDFNGALNYFNKAKQEWPTYSYVYVNLGVLNSALQKFEESEKNFKYGIQLNPNNPEAYHYYAIMLQKAGRIEEAKNQVEIGLRLSPQHSTLNSLKMDLNALSKIAQANTNQGTETWLEKCKTNPTAINYVNLSLEYYNKGQYEECIAACKEAIKLKPDYDIPYNNMCSAYNVLKKWDEAIAAGKRAVELNPSSQLAKNNLQAALNGKAGK